MRNKDIFNFRIINTPDGNQIIDKRLKTPYNALTPVQMMEYMEMDSILFSMDIMDRQKARQKERIKIERKRMCKIAKNPFYKLASICGLI